MQALDLPNAWRERLHDTPYYVTYVIHACYKKFSLSATIHTASDENVIDGQGTGLRRNIIIIA